MSAQLLRNYQSYGLEIFTQDRVIILDVSPALQFDLGCFA